MASVSDSWFKEPKASELVRMRQEARVKWNIPYDCVEGKVKADKVCCSKGIPINVNSPDGCLGLAAVLKGRSGKNCKNCEYYNADYEED